MTAPRSYLYVPGDHEGRLAKAFTRGADALIVDLEDAVAASAKDAARETLSRWLTSLSTVPVPVWVRINAGEQRHADIEAVAPLPHVTGLVVAKTDSVDELLELDRHLDALGSPVLLAPLIESARGVHDAFAIASGPRVDVVHLGEVDLAADLDLTPGEDERELLYARSQVVVAARAARINPPVAPVSADISNLAHFAATTAGLQRMGFFGRACIHPDQVRIANAAYTPSHEQLEWARTMLAATTDGVGVWRDADGNMVDEAVLRRARRIVDGPQPDDPDRATVASP